MPDFDPNIRTFRFTKDNKHICVGYNIKAGCKYVKTPNGCKHEHLCDVRMPDGTACGQPHTRFNHV